MQASVCVLVHTRFPSADGDGDGTALMQLLTRTGEASDQESDVDALTLLARALGGILVLFGLVILVFGMRLCMEGARLTAV